MGVARLRKLPDRRAVAAARLRSDVPGPARWAATAGADARAKAERVVRSFIVIFFLFLDVVSRHY